MNIMQVITDYVAKSILTTAGDILVRGAALPERLASGALDTFLKGAGAGVAPTYHLLPACRVRLSANYAVPTATWTKIPMDVVDYDVTTDYDVPNRYFLCSEVGRYLITVCLHVDSLNDGNTYSVVVKKNGAYSGCFQTIRTGGNGGVCVSLSDIQLLAVNDYIEPFIFHDFPGDRDILGNINYATYMAIHRLS